MEQLKRLRTARGLSQARLAARAEIDPSTVNQIERGAREASPATLRKLAEALEVGIADLLESGSPKAPGPARQPDTEEPAGPVDENQEIHREMLEGFLLGWKEELTRWERKFPAGSRPKVFDYGKLVGWSWAVVGNIDRLKSETRRNFDLVQSAEMAYTLERMEEAKQAVRRMLERVSESKTEAEFREILEANEMGAAVLNNAEPDA